VEPTYNGTARNRKSLSCKQIPTCNFDYRGPEPRDRKDFLQKTVFPYATFCLRQVLMYIDQYLGVGVVKRYSSLVCPRRSEVRVPAKVKHLFSHAWSQQSLLATQTPTQRVLDFFPGGKATEA